MAQQINQQMSLSDIITLLILSALWGGSFFFVEILVAHLPPLTIVTAQVTLAALALWIIVWTLKLPTPKTWQHWRGLALIGLLNNALPFCLIVWGQTQISSSLASILNATTPFFTVLIAGAILMDEALTKMKFIGVIIGLLGTIILIGPDALMGQTDSLLGQLAVIAAALSYAIAGVYARRFKTWQLSPLIIATGQVTMASLILLPLTLILDQPWENASLAMSAVLALCGLAFFSTVIAYILYFRLIERAGATNAALVTFLVPISASLLGVIILGENFTALHALGMGLIALGLLIMDGRMMRYIRGLS